MALTDNSTPVPSSTHHQLGDGINEGKAKITPEIAH
jgi:hypothetical protein